MVESSFAAAGVSISVEVRADLRLRGFPNEYAQVLLNLLNNAKEAIAGSAGGPGRVVIRLDRTDGFGRLSVLDNGGGVPEEIRDRIFEPYFSTRQAGTGIGLYMSRQIIEQNMGGRLVTRNVGEGAEFSVLVPLAEEGA